MTTIVLIDVGLSKEVQKAEKFTLIQGYRGANPRGQPLSVNVGVLREIEQRNTIT